MATAALVTEVQGHEDVRRDLATAVDRGDLPGSLLLHGIPGVGRQSLARWLARLLVCDAPTRGGPCDACVGCRLALELQHPDIHWFFPLPRPKGASSPEKLADALEQARYEVLAERRQDPLYLPPDDDPGGLYLAQVRTIRRQGSRRPAMARRQVFIVGHAERLVPQEASEEAANALLKILEEPPADTTFILTAADPEALLPTLRSRLLPVRLRPLPEPVVRSFLSDHAGADQAEAARVARLAAGSIGRALALLPRDGAPSRAQAVRDDARAWLDAALADDPAARFGAAHGQASFGARAGFGDTLDALALWLRDLAAVAAAAPDQVGDPHTLPHLRALAARIRADGIPQAIRAVEEARDGGRINANPQLTLAWVLGRIGAALGTAR